MKNIEVNGFKQVTKTTAKKVFESGQEFYACPCKLRPGAPWYNEIIISPESRYVQNEVELAGSFEKAMNAALWYNCNSASGKYLRFYIRTQREG